MTLIKTAFATVLALSLAGCSGTWETDYDKPLDPGVTKSWRVSDVRVLLPENLTTSEQNTLAPNFDIVWHGEPLGDRKAQVAAIVKAGVKKGSSRLRGSRRVKLRVILQEFHAVTPAAVSRAPAAVHDIRYTIQAFDARTGRALSEPVATSADLTAYVGAQAVIAAQQGQTQKVRIRDHLARVTAGWLGIGPDPRGEFSGIGR